MAKRDLSSILGEGGDGKRKDAPDAPAADPGVPQARPSRHPDGPLWRFLGRDRMTSPSRIAATVRYKKLVAAAKDQPPAVVVALLHDELVWAYPRLNGPGEPLEGNQLPQMSDDRIEWDVAALTIDKINHQLCLATERSEDWAAAIVADVERRDL